MLDGGSDYEVRISAMVGGTPVGRADRQFHDRELVQRQFAADDSWRNAVRRTLAMADDPGGGDWIRTSAGFESAGGVSGTIGAS
jgi:hypothetical protein